MKLIQQQQNPRTLGAIYLRALHTLQGIFEVMKLLTEKIISYHRVITIPIIQEVVDMVEALSNKFGSKCLLKLKYHREGTIRKDDGENDDRDYSISGVDDEDEKECELTIEYDIIYNEKIVREELQELNNEGILTP